MNTIPFEAIIALVALLVVALQSFWLNKSVPRDVALKIVESGDKLSKQTATTLDDNMIALVKMLLDQWIPTTVTSVNPDTGVTTTHDVVLSVDATPTLTNIANEAYATGSNMTVEWLDAMQAENDKHNK